MSNLREWLILTTQKTTYEKAMSHFRQHYDDQKMLTELVAIALEGEDNGDAPWAAANVISEFPVELLIPHETQLRRIAAERWIYLSGPAKKALQKIAGAGL